MPVAITLADHGLGVLLTASGMLSGRDVLETNIAFLSRHLEEFEACRYWFADFSQVSASTVTEEDLQRVAALFSWAGRHNLRLVVALSGPRAKESGFSRELTSFGATTGWTIEVFRSADDARAWLRSTVQPQLSFI